MPPGIPVRRYPFQQSPPHASHPTAADAMPSRRIFLRISRISGTDPIQLRRPRSLWPASSWFTAVSSCLRFSSCSTRSSIGLPLPPSDCDPRAANGRPPSIERPPRHSPSPDSIPAASPVSPHPSCRVTSGRLRRRLDRVFCEQGRARWGVRCRGW